ncbi:MAG: MFS transporter, partial [Chloroflexota bacterium]|nr:MFS transporter [Chloroflexota bacterium]
MSVLWLLGISTIMGLVLLPSASFPASLSLIREEWGLSNFQAGVIYSAYQVSYLGAVLVLLPLTDRLDTRAVALVSVVLSVVGNALFPLFGQGFISGSLLRAVAGVGLVGIYMPGLRLVAERFAQRHRGGAVGIYVGSFTLGTAVSLGLTGLLIPSLGWRGAYLTLSLAGIAALPLAYVVLRGVHRPAIPPSSGTLDLAVLGNRGALLTILGYAAHSWELFAARVWVAPFLAAILVARGGGTVEAAATAAATAAVLFGAGALVGSVAGLVSDRLGRAITAGAILSVSALCSLVFGWLWGMPWEVIILVGLVYGLTIASDSPIYSTGVTELARPGQLGSTMAVQSFFGFSASIMAPVVFGFILDWGAGLGWGLA